MIDFIRENAVELLGVLLAVSEALALIPGLESNSVLQFVISTLKRLAGKESE